MGAPDALLFEFRLAMEDDRGEATGIDLKPG